MGQFDCNFLSYTFNRAINIHVIVPSIVSGDVEKSGVSHKIEYKYPVVYLLHGYCNDASTCARYTSLERYAEERQIAVVTFSAENGYYLNHNDILKNQTDFLKIVQNDYELFLIEELPEFVCTMFPISDKAEHTYIAGISMGGYGAMYHGLKYPEKFRSIGSFSPLTTLRIAPYDSFEQLDEKLLEYEPLYLLDKLKQGNNKIPSLYYSYGAKDFLVETQDWFRQELTKRGIPYCLDYNTEYGHEWQFWDEQIHKFLDYIPRDDYYANCPKREV
ncbi:MAG: alpha/beta hydrolase-fold protein [Eubacteriales bacterium]